MSRPKKSVFVIFTVTKLIFIHFIQIHLCIDKKYHVMYIDAPGYNVSTKIKINICAMRVNMKDHAIVVAAGS